MKMKYLQAGAELCQAQVKLEVVVEVGIEFGVEVEVEVEACHYKSGWIVVGEWVVEQTRGPNRVNNS